MSDPEVGRALREIAKQMEIANKLMYLKTFSTSGLEASKVRQELWPEGRKQHG